MVFMILQNKPKPKDILKHYYIYWYFLCAIRMHIVKVYQGK